jgi:hypothetical protein
MSRGSRGGYRGGYDAMSSASTGYNTPNPYSGGRGGHSGYQRQQSE